MTDERQDGKSLGRQVNRLVAGLELDTASGEEISTLAAQLCELGKEAVERLARGILRPGPWRREKVTALLACLSGQPAAWALDALGRLMASPRLSPTERVWLLATAQRLEEAARPPEDPGEQAQRPPPDAGGGGGAAAVDDAAELLLWRDEMAALPPPDQEAALEPLLHSGDPTFLPVLEVALSLGSPQLDAAIARGLARFATRESLPLLRELIRRPDPAVRRLALTTLAALERQGVATRDVFVAAARPDASALSAFVAEPDLAGKAAVVVAGRRGDGLIRYAVVIVDTVETGILEVWGDSAATDAELRECAADLAEGSGLELRPAPLNTAQALVAAAEEFARRQGRQLPPEYIVWRRLIGTPTEEVKLRIVFGPRCVDCGVELVGKDIERGGLVLGRMALCAKCAGEPRRCAACGRTLRPWAEQVAVQEGKGRIEFVCLACTQRAEDKQP